MSPLPRYTKRGGSPAADPSSACRREAAAFCVAAAAAADSHLHHLLSFDLIPSLYAWRDRMSHVSRSGSSSALLELVSPDISKTNRQDVGLSRRSLTTSVFSFLVTLRNQPELLVETFHGPIAASLLTRGFYATCKSTNKFIRL